jgi:hypothetical protein
MKMIKKCTKKKMIQNWTFIYVQDAVIVVAITVYVWSGEVNHKKCPFCAESENIKMCFKLQKQTYWIECFTCHARGPAIENEIFGNLKSTLTHEEMFEDAFKFWNERRRVP